VSSSSNPDKPELIAVPLAAVTADKPLLFSVYLKRPLDPSDPFQEIVAAGKSLSAEIKRSILAKVDTVYILRRAWPQFFSSVAKFQPGGSDFLSQLDVARNWAILYAIESEIKGTLEKSSFEKQKLLSDWLALSLARVTSTKGFFRRFKDSELYLVNHSFNVAIACSIVAKKLGLGMDATRLVTLGALLHNIGNIQVPRALLHKTGPLTKPEWDKMKVHPHRGAEMLYQVNAPREVILTSMQHHERLDGNGYPELIYGHEIHLFAKICSAVDVFDAMKSPRPYETSMSQDLAIQTIVNMGTRFEGQILNIVSSIEE
jgi:putative nucleotidyltransferase with HDIG domain